MLQKGTVATHFDEDLGRALLNEGLGVGQARGGEDEGLALREHLPRPIKRIKYERI